MAVAIGDPDSRIVATLPNSFVNGVPVGVEGMPRTPAVYERKQH